MTESIRFEPLRLTDAVRLRQSANQLAGSHNLTEIRQIIRHYQALCPNELWLAEQQGVIQAVAGFQLIDPLSRRAVLHLHTSDQIIQSEVLAAVLNKAFLESDVFRLELLVPADSAAWLPAVRAVGLTEEGRLRSCRFDSLTKRHQDVLLYSMIRPEFPLSGSAFVLFRLGVLAINGNRQDLQGAEFVKFGEQFDRAAQQESAELLGLLDGKGRLLPRDDLDRLKKGQSGFFHARTPEVVRKAAEQAAAYFSGQLTHFDIPLDLSCGSGFQQRVWRLLSEIPYGATWTYEELAHHLGQEDWPTARKMSRAVGSACGANPLPLFLPCHRVIGKDGRLVGFAGGLDIKEYLLAHEIMGIND